MVVCTSIAVYFAFGSLGLSPLVRSYIAAVLGALLVILCEINFPHYDKWKGSREDIWTDGLFMVSVQMILPFLLAATLSIGVLNWLRSVGVEPMRFWPHALPVTIQVVLMLLLADLLRYWLHVASHKSELLWRLHAVHHSPPKLYWLNVGRFHPLEKTLQYLLDALPFVVMGVSEPVLALYFVFYSVNGFFQHSNIDLRFGWLNWIISSAELHRWHHSRLFEESCANYGNNLIVWDVVFRTRFLPEDRQIEDIGLPNRGYPSGFLEQMKTPFVKGVQNAESDLVSWAEIAANWLIRVRMTVTRWTAWPLLLAWSRAPGNTQRLLLRSILVRNRATEFGREHGFGAIRNYDQYRASVSIQNYESLRPLIEKQDQHQIAALTSEHPILFAQTSGTTGAPKYIPVLSRSISHHRQCQELFAYVQFKANRSAYDGRMLAIVSPAVEGHLATGTPYGSTSGQLYKNMPGVMRAKYIVPPEVFSIEDYDLKYLLILRLAIVERNITYISTANPSTLLRLISMLQEHRLGLLHDVETGGFSRAGELAAEVFDAVQPRFACSRSRREEVRVILRKEQIALADLWPFIKLLSTWTGGSCGIALDTVRESLPATTHVAELGYLSSEFFGSITVDADLNIGVPSLGHNFFEFVARDLWEADEPEFLLIDQLKVGSEYYVLVTTQTGLYRYFMNDIVVVTGWFNKTPTLQFLQKGKGVTSITGEKLYESQVIKALKAAQKTVGIRIPFFIMVADAEIPGYRLLIEPAGELDPVEFAEEVEQQLFKQNLEYEQKRLSGRLRPILITLLDSGAAEAYKAECLSRGQREAQFKVQVLQSVADLDFQYQAHLKDGLNG